MIVERIRIGLLAHTETTASVVARDVRQRNLCFEALGDVRCLVQYHAWALCSLLQVRFRPWPFNLQVRGHPLTCLPRMIKSRFVLFRNVTFCVANPPSPPPHPRPLNRTQSTFRASLRCCRSPYKSLLFASASIRGSPRASSGVATSRSPTHGPSVRCATCALQTPAPTPGRIPTPTPTPTPTPFGLHFYVSMRWR